MLTDSADRVGDKMVGLPPSRFRHPELVSGSMNTALPILGAQMPMVAETSSA
jgi:hypothetical protein